MSKDTSTKKPKKSITTTTTPAVHNAGVKKPRLSTRTISNQPLLTGIKRIMGMISCERESALRGQPIALHAIQGMATSFIKTVADECVNLAVDHRKPRKGGKKTRGLGMITPALVTCALKNIFSDDELSSSMIRYASTKIRDMHKSSSDKARGVH